MSRPSSVPPSSVQKKKRKYGESDEIDTITPENSDLPTEIAPDTPATATVRAPVFVPAPDGSPYYLTSDVPMNRQRFKYTPAGPSPEGSILAYRTLESRPSGYVRVSWEDRSPFVRVTPDGLGIAGEKGFRSARCNVPVREGKWYLEILVENNNGVGKNDASPDSPHVRLGWGRREAPLNGPVGMDGYSYGVRDKTGEKITLSRPRPYGRPFGPGDVIGLYISLPPRREADPNDPHDPAIIKRKRIPILYKNQLYFEAMDYAPSKEMVSLTDLVAKPTAPTPAPSKKGATVKNIPNLRNKSRPPISTPTRPLPTLQGSSIAFFINGQCQGRAFRDIYDYAQLRSTAESRKTAKRGLDAYLKERENVFDDGTLGYYPFISLFNDARVRINAGPDFSFPPPPNIDALLEPPNLPTNLVSGTERSWRPLCERYAEYMTEVWALDAKEEEEAAMKAAAMDAEEKLEEDKKAARDRKRRAKEEEKRKLARKELRPTPTPIDDRFGSSASGFSAPIQRAFGITDLLASDPPTPNFDSGVDMEIDIEWNSADEAGDADEGTATPGDDEVVVLPTLKPGAAQRAEWPGQELEPA